MASTRVNVEKLLREMVIRGWNGVDLAYFSGVTPATVSAAMQGRQVSATTVAKIARALLKAAIIPGAEELLA